MKHNRPPTQAAVGKLRRHGRSWSCSGSVPGESSSTERKRFDRVSMFRNLENDRDFSETQAASSTNADASRSRLRGGKWDGTCKVLGEGS